MLYYIMNKINENLIFNNNENNKLIEHTINEIHKNINEYDLSLKNLTLRYKKVYKYENMFLFIIYKNGKILTVFNSGDTRKQTIINIIKDRLLNLEKKFGKLPNMFIPLYISDTHFYHDNEIPFFVEAKPSNKKGILYPDTNFYSIKLDNKIINYDNLKNTLEENNCSNIKNKSPIIYFSGANTGSNKHNIRRKIKEIVIDNDDKKYNIFVSEQYVPLYDFCKYKYLLNLPGHQPWSYRMSKILLMNSLVIDIPMTQTYINNLENKIYDRNDKWIQIYSDYFISGKDYVEVNYDWIDNLTSDLEVYGLYNKINKIYNYYQQNIDEYLTISKNGTKKANELNMDIINNTWDYLIIYFNKQIYENNTEYEINNFIDNILLSEKNIKEVDIKYIKEHDIDRDYFIKKVFIDEVLKISNKKYNVLYTGIYEKYKVEFIYDNIIKLNSESNLLVISDNNNYNINNKNRIEYIKDNIINGILNLDNTKKHKFDIIFIIENQDTENLFESLNVCWNVLKYNGILIVDIYCLNKTMEEIDEYYYFKTFKEMNNIEISKIEKIGKRILIHKVNLHNINKNIPIHIKDLIYNYIDTYPKELIIKLPKQNKTKIEWNFIMSNSKYQQDISLGYNKKLDKYLESYVFNYSSIDSSNSIKY